LFFVLYVNFPLSHKLVGDFHTFVLVTKTSFHTSTSIVFVSEIILARRVLLDLINFNRIPRNIKFSLSISKFYRTVLLTTYFAQFNI
ncbi:hypothetical protein BpHYR1_042297, partial [Brachionus plicatilis]